MTISQGQGWRSYDNGYGSMIIEGTSSYDRVRACQSMIGNARILSVDFFPTATRNNVSIRIEGISDHGSVAAKGQIVTLITRLETRDRLAMASLVEVPWDYQPPTD